MTGVTWRDQSFSLVPYVFIIGAGTCSSSALALQLLASQLDARVIPPQYPRERKDGTLSIRDVPESVAEQWVTMNPGVRSVPPVS
ncbi:hypothetical protein ABZ807_02195 [Micromonospora sp. NPDC047548]|uniref:hypothetical protein n=1 Tax=Micromonospora sp. NPDC047548 TaxID=3155624 RepID=UPI0033EF12FF